MNSYLAKLSELNKVKNQNKTLEKIIQINLALMSIKEDVAWLADNDWYISNEQAKKIKAIREFALSTDTISEEIEK